MCCECALFLHSFFCVYQIVFFSFTKSILFCTASSMYVLCSMNLIGWYFWLLLVYFTLFWILSQTVTVICWKKKYLSSTSLRLQFAYTKSAEAQRSRDSLHIFESLFSNPHMFTFFIQFSLAIVSIDFLFTWRFFVCSCCKQKLFSYAFSMKCIFMSAVVCRRILLQNDA